MRADVRVSGWRHGLPRARLVPIALACVVAQGAACRRSREGSGTYVAVSLRELQRQLRAGSQDPALPKLGGIGRVLGLIHDRATEDLILIGKVLGGQAAPLDDLVVALRARLLHNAWPLVNIEPVRDSGEPSVQAVSYQAGIENTAFGRTLYEADVVLKKYSLGLQRGTPDVAEAPSYSSLWIDHMIADTQKQSGAVTAVRELSSGPGGMDGVVGRKSMDSGTQTTRFWFYAHEPADVVDREDVFCISKLEMEVRREQVSADGIGAAGADQAAADFATRFSSSLERLSQVFPVVQRMKFLWDLTTVAESIRTLKQRPDLDYLLGPAYVVAPVATPTQHPVESFQRLVERANGQAQVVRISGGIQFRSEVRRLNLGDATPLKGIALSTRPSETSVIWRLPLEAWNMPNTEYLPAGLAPTSAARTTDDQAAKPGCFVGVQSVQLAGPGERRTAGLPTFHGFQDVPRPGGVLMAPPLTIRVRNLLDVRRSILDSRTDPNALSWPVEDLPGGAKQKEEGRK